jgi:hypothetical protein
MVVIFFVCVCGGGGSATPCASPPQLPSIFFQLFFFGSTTLLTGMTSISLHMQWPLTSQLHGSVSPRQQLFFFRYGSNSRPLTA